MPLLKRQQFFTALQPLILSFGIACAVEGHAAEGGSTVYPLGVENFVAGALPPPGYYGMLFGQHYRATTLKDKDGNTVPVPFELTADVVAPRLIHVTDQTVAGGNLAFHAIFPVVHLDVRVGPRRQTRSGLGDITTGFSIGWHHTPKLHSLAGVDVFVPTGRYKKDDLANIGRNYWAAEPLYVVSYIDPNGFNADIKLGYIFNRTNTDTDYRSGQEFHFDYALGWGFANNWTAGVGGYVYQQTTSDRQGSNDLAGSKGRAFSIGPSIKYDSGKGWFVTAKWQKEMAVRNRPEGSAFWVKAAFPL
ncbi:SphA family protein [Noviherbaspirillum sedimenti]|uniref:Phenol degradation protein meta n=1 Tax=Noviherbaspirillum sedimenti TaxID=2320865 RepID=A0A3A3G3H2_9BURK|nr:transporter [Noviherbaspirillum sedimenti]RJG01032.1 hypothetical protein D3878_05080 [Noviherbaspirillum sedimenti]